MISKLVQGRIVNITHEWIVDPGATLHMTTNMSDFVSYAPCSKHVTGIDVEGIGEGSVKDWLLNADGTLTLTPIRGVLHVPELRHTTDKTTREQPELELFSASSATQEEHTITMQPGASFIQFSYADATIPLQQTGKLFHLDAGRPAITVGERVIQSLRKYESFAQRHHHRSFSATRPTRLHPST
eukprot:scaffold114842_cov16-Prasinocladus_malaysianus.AAC.1